ncbi:MAG: transporter substrate-binding domain-containing protein [Spirochaetes bacterium]|nr:transporter substrate-binding domain-containing protein [Spirochaetota bacterium]
MKKLNFIFILLLFIILIYIKEVKASMELKVVFSYYPPYEYLDQKDNQMKGIDYELVKNTFEILNIKILFNQLPWERCLNMLKYGEADAIFSLLYSKERAEFLLYPKEYLSFEENVFFTLKENKIKWNNNYDSLKNYLIGCVLGYSYEEKFDNKKDLKKIYLKDDETIVKMLINKRIDLGIGNIHVIKFIIKELNIDGSKIEFLTPFISRKPLYIAFSRINLDKHFVEKFDKVFAEFKKTKTYNDIFIKYNFK